MTASRAQRHERLARAGIGPRGLSREEAATYVGVSASKFDTLVTDGLMPAPKRLGDRRIWDRHALDSAFDALPDEQGRATDADDVWAHPQV